MDTRMDEKAGKCPVAHGTTNVGMRSEQGLVADPTGTSGCFGANSPQAVRSHGQGFHHVEAFKKLRLCRPEERPCRADDGQPGLVAGGFRATMAGPMIRMACASPRARTGYRRRARRRRRWPAAGRPRFLGWQCEPRQGAPALVAHQTEIRLENLCGPT